MTKFNTLNQLEAFEEFKEKTKEPLKNLTPLTNNTLNYSKNKYQGVNKTPYFSIDRRYTTKKITNKKEG